MPISPEPNETLVYWPELQRQIRDRFGLGGFVLAHLEPVWSLENTMRPSYLMEYPPVFQSIQVILGLKRRVKCLKVYGHGFVVGVVTDNKGEGSDESDGADVSLH